MTYDAVYRGTVTNTDDPQDEGRAEVEVPAVLGAGTSAWAAVLGAGVTVDDTVIVAFEGGDASFPVVLGRIGGGAVRLPGGLTVAVDGTDTVLRHEVSGASVRFGQDGSLTLHATTTVRVEGAQLTCSCPSVHLDSTMVDSNGIVRADTVMTNFVVASNYTPGAGNIW